MFLSGGNDSNVIMLPLCLLVVLMALMSYVSIMSITSCPAGLSHVNGIRRSITKT